MNGIVKICIDKGLKQAHNEAAEEVRKQNLICKKRVLALKRMVNHYPDILPFVRDACDLQICSSQSEARRLFVQLREN